MQHHTNRRGFIRLMAGAALAPSAMRGARPDSPTARGTSLPQGRQILETFDYAGVQLRSGMLKQQYDATREFYFSMNHDDALKGFRQNAGLPAPGKGLGGWCSKDSSVAFGQWLSGMARMSRATGDTPMLNKATQLMEDWGKTIGREGSSFVPWGGFAHYAWEKFVCGLVDLYAYGNQKAALPLLSRITDWAVPNLSRARRDASDKDSQGGFFTGDAEWYTLSENLYRAYFLTGDDKYKTFGDVWLYPDYWGVFTGNSKMDPAGLHGYSHVNTLSSAAMAYAVTGDREYLDEIVKAYDFFQNSQCYATGGYGPGEKLMALDGSLGESIVEEPNTKYLRTFVGRSFETPCGSWAVFKLCRYLMTFTGEARFGDWMEKMVYNGIGAALPMADPGRTFYYADYRLAGGTKNYHPDAWPCCSGTYIQAVADYQNIIYFKDAVGLYVNLFIPSEVGWNHQGEEVKVVQETSYPESDTTTLTVHTGGSARFALRFRVPGWASSANVKVNGAPVKVAAKAGTWAAVERTWRSGDRVEFQIPMRLAYVPIDVQHPHRVAAVHGPVVLVRTQEDTILASQADLSDWLSPGDKPLEFRAQAKSAGTFVPFYKVGFGVPYRMYFDLRA